MRYTSNGSAVANFSLATEEKFKGKDGEYRKQTEWHKVSVWNKLAELVSQHLHKGSNVFVEGSIKYREWEDKSGNKRTSTEILASSVRFLDGKPQEVKQAPTPPEPSDEITDDDIPF